MIRSVNPIDPIGAVIPFANPDELDTLPMLDAQVPSPSPTPYKPQSLETLDEKRDKYQRPRMCRSDTVVMGSSHSDPADTDPAEPKPEDDQALKSPGAMKILQKYLSKPCWVYS